MIGEHFDSVFVSLPAKLDDIDRNVLNAPAASVIQDVRNKVVAHVAVEHDGIDWKLWSVGGTKLTYSQLDEYIDACTSVVATLSSIVLRTSFAFDDVDSVNERYVNEYIDALVIGLNEQKQAKERRREEILRRTRSLSGSSD